MADAKATNHILRGVTALYPRINRTYKFDPAAGERGKTVPCDTMEEGAKYEINFRMTEAQAKELYAAMALCYADKKQAK